MLPDVAPTVEEEAPVCFQLGELDALVRFEAVPEVRAAVAHQFHLPLAFLVAGDELDPVVGKGESLHDSVMGTSPVVPFPVAHQPDFAFRASRFPFCSFSKGRPSRAFNLSLLRLSDSAESGAMAADSSASAIDSTAVLSKSI